VTRKETIEALSCVGVFAALPRTSLERVAKVATQFEAPVGQVLIEPNAKGSGMFVLLDGTATVHVRGQATRELEAGQCFGELALLTPAAVRSARVRAKTDVRCLAITRSDFRTLLEAEPKLTLALLETVAVRLAAQE
jgi:CRP-like cAMP-binding protein